MTAPDPDSEPAAPDPPARRSAFRKMAGQAAGWLLLGFGMLTLPTPLPVGLPLIALALYLLARESGSVRRAIRRLRLARPGLSRRLDGIKTRVPGGVRRLIETTDPTRLARRRRRRKGRVAPQEGE